MRLLLWLLRCLLLNVWRRGHDLLVLGEMWHWLLVELLLLLLLLLLGRDSLLL